MASRRILVVRPRIGRRTCAARWPLGAEVLEARDADHAVHLLAQHHRRVDIVLVECDPAPSGGLARLISRVSRACSGTPIVGLLGKDATISLVLEALRAGARDFVRAPLHHDELIAVVDRLAPQRRRLIRESEAKQAAVRPVIDFLSLNPTHPLSIRELAALSELTRTKLCRTFREVTGRPIRSFVTELRLTLARQLLQTSAMPITDIAQEAGFYDLAQLDHVFRKRYGFAPSAVRAQVRARDARATLYASRPYKIAVQDSITA